MNIERLDQTPSAADLRRLGELLSRAVEDGEAMSFLAPLPVDRAAAWWGEQAAGLGDRSAVLVGRVDGVIVAAAMVLESWAPNQPHRGEIAKVVVDPAHRGQGFGRRMMEAAESLAAGFGFTLLTLDAKRGGAAERLYARLGWTYVGAIPGFAVDPDGVTPHDAVIYYKRVRGGSEVLGTSGEAI